MRLISFLFCIAFTCHCSAEHVYRSPAEKRAADTTCNVMLNTASKKVEGIVGKMDKHGDTLVGKIRTLDRHIFTRIDAIEDRILELEEMVNDRGYTRRLSKKMDRILEKMDQNEENLFQTIQSSDENLIEKVATVRADVEDLLVKETLRSCRDLIKLEKDESGVYMVSVHEKQIQVYCDMDSDGGGWLVFQRRKDGSVDFYRDWESYKTGFGNLTGEFWLGNENLYLILLNPGQEFEFRVDLEDFEGEKRFAKYSTFSIASEEDNYRLTIGGYSGNAGDSMNAQHDQQFSTKDRDNDNIGGEFSCAELYKGALWYNSCHAFANLNGQYLHGQHASMGDGVDWRAWKGRFYSLKFTEMKVRPKI